MDKIAVNQRTIGVNFNQEGLADILVWAPHAQTVAIRVNGEETLHLSGQAYGYWQLSTSCLKPGMSYEIIIDQQTLPDITSLSQPEIHGASVAFDLNDYQWTDQEWDNIPLEHYIIYELHTGTFTPEGTFSGIIEKLDYLKSLGITAIELMPVAQFPGDRNWGYDGIFPFAVHHSYGGVAGLRHLVDMCHQKGLAVVLDVVYNHVGPEGNYLDKYGPFFTNKYKTPWGNAVNFDDAGCDGVRRYFIENALMWLRDFHIDALRMDAVHAIKDFSPKHILREIREYTDQLMQHTGKKHYLIVECDLNDTRFINPVEKDGYGMDAQWTDEFHHALRVIAGGKKEGYYTDFNGLSDLAESFEHGYVYHGQFSAQREKSFGTDPVNNPGKQFVVFSQNHDQVGNRMLGERSSQLFSFEMQKLMAATVLVSPFLPMLFMGEEYSEQNSFLYFVSHTDPALVEAVRKGRREEFAAFHAEGEAPDPQSPDTFTRSKLNWDSISQQPNETMLRYYRALISLRKSIPALQTPDRSQCKVIADTNAKTLTLFRSYGQQTIVCILNFSNEIRSVVLPENLGNHEEIFNSADQQWNGPGPSAVLNKGNSVLTLQPESIIILKQNV